MPFPLALLPTIPNSFESMKGSQALQYQNTFMKNALIRALNRVHELAPRIKPASKELRQFADYVEVVCKLFDNHIEGDELFLKRLAQETKMSYCAIKCGATVQAALKGMRSMVETWKKDPKAYLPTRLLDALVAMDKDINEVLHKQSVKFRPESIPKGISDDKLFELIGENLAWIVTKVDMNLVLPFCVSHHDIKTSPHWPTVHPDAIQKELPKLVKVHADMWKLAPFDPLTRKALKCPV
ncbi:hypothetical protein CVT24_004091 [Panaeolus cyanescens]|uniref:Hemerythrin-like domain-containing protein n=1 Tax=Panaeolus cyanescens TaxID=181874 RepID=A0A409Y5V9_9AGAR|nr:hypothetical protein CVT24_004091 [Panaeolus cyanescens]